MTLSDPSGLDGLPSVGGTLRNGPDVGTVLSGDLRSGFVIRWDFIAGEAGASGAGSQSPIAAYPAPEWLPWEPPAYDEPYSEEMHQGFLHDWQTQEPGPSIGPPSPTATYDREAYEQAIAPAPQRLWIFENLGPSLGTSIGQITGNTTAGQAFDLGLQMGMLIPGAQGGGTSNAFKKLTLTEPWETPGTLPEQTLPNAGTEQVGQPGSYSRTPGTLTQRAATIQQSFIDAGILGKGSKRFNPVAVTQGNVPGSPRIVTVGSMKAYIAIAMGEIPLAEGEVLGPPPPKRVGGKLPAEGHVEVLGILAAENDYGATGGFVGTVPPQCETCFVNMGAVPSWTHTNPMKPKP